MTANDPREQVGDADRRELGETSGPMEDELEHAFTRQVTEGVQRLHRPWREVLVTGWVGGTDIAVGIMALLLVYEETGSHLLAGLAFPIAFLALLLARAELFTEGFLVPVVTVVARRASVGQLLKLWSGTLVANLAGGWVIMWLVMAAFPHLHDDTVELGTEFATAPLSVESFSLAVVAGLVITLMTRMQHGSDSTVAKIAAAWGAGFLLAGSGMFHSILDSLLIFGALHTGAADFGYGEWAWWFAYTVVGNLLGGLLLVTSLRLVRSKDRLRQEHADVAAEKRARR